MLLSGGSEMGMKPRPTRAQGLALHGAVSRLVEELKASGVSKVEIDLERGEAVLTYQTTKRIVIKGD